MELFKEGSTRQTAIKIYWVVTSLQASIKLVWCQPVNDWCSGGGSLWGIYQCVVTAKWLLAKWQPSWGEDSPRVLQMAVRHIPFLHTQWLSTEILWIPQCGRIPVRMTYLCRRAYSTAPVLADSSLLSMPSTICSSRQWERPLGHIWPTAAVPRHRIVVCVQKDGRMRPFVHRDVSPPVPVGLSTWECSWECLIYFYRHSLCECHCGIPWQCAWCCVVQIYLNMKASFLLYKIWARAVVSGGFSVPSPSLADEAIPCYESNWQEMAQLCTNLLLNGHRTSISQTESKMAVSVSQPRCQEARCYWK